MSSSSGTSDASRSDLSLIRNARIAITHEATLQDLLRCSNDAVHHLISERNKLLRDRGLLGVEKSKYFENDFLTPPPEPLPYKITESGHILRCRVKGHQGARYPEDPRLVDVGVQTSDPDATLVDIDPNFFVEGVEVSNIKKRKRM